MPAESIIGARSSLSASHVVLPKTTSVTLAASDTTSTKQTLNLTTYQDLLPKTTSVTLAASETTSTKQTLNLTAYQDLLPKSKLFNFKVGHGITDYGYGSFNFTINGLVYPRSTTFLADLRIDSKYSYFAATHTVNQKTTETRDDLAGRIAISPPMVESLQGKMSVRETNSADGTAFIWGVRDSDITSQVNVIRTKNEYLDSRISIRENNELQGKVPTIWGESKGDLASVIYAVYPADKDLSMQLRVSSDYILEQTIEGDMYGYNKPSKLSVNVKTDNDVLSTIGVRFSNLMTGTSFIWGTNELELSGNINVYQVSHLRTTLGVTPANRMTAIVDITQPMRITDILTAKRDAFVREAYPKLNYGAEQTLVAGYSESRQEVFRSLIGFNITDILSMSTDYKLERIILKLKHSLGRTPTIPLELRAVNGSWAENSVTWSNQPDMGEIVNQGIYFADEARGFITFDITDFILQAKKQGADDISLYLVAADETANSVQFFSMDAGISQAPSLEYTYFDEVIRSTGRSGIDTKILVTYPRVANLSSKINIYKYSSNNDLTGKITVTPSGKRFENLPSSFTVSRPNMAGKGIVKQSTWGDMKSTISIREASLFDLENGKLTVSRPNLQTKLYVANRKDTPSKLDVRVWGEDSLYGWVIVNIKDRPSTITVRPYIDKVGIITVQRSVDVDILSSFVVSEKVKVGIIDVLYRDDIEGTMTVQGGDVSEIASSISVSRPDLLGRIEVNPYSDFGGRIVVRHSRITEIPSGIVASIPNMPSKVYVRFMSDLLGKITVRRKDNHRICSSLSISRPDMFGNIFPKIHSDIVGSIIVRRLEGENFLSKIDVPHRQNIWSEIDVVGASMIPSSIRVNSGYLFGRLEIPAYGNEYLSSKFIVRVRLASDIDSVIDVYQYDLLDGSMTVRQTFEKSINSELVVRRTEEDDLLANIDVWITRDLAGRIVVRRSVTDSFNSQAYVLNRKDINGKLEVLERNNLSGSIRVVYVGHSDFLGKLTAKIRAYGDLETTLDVTTGGSKDIIAVLGVAPTNRMTGIVDITQPIREHETLSAVKDTYVREAVPTLNYGEETSFAVGNYQENRLRSLLGFNIDSLKDGYEVDKVELKLYYGQSPTKTLRLMGVMGQWSEYGTTWINRPNTGSEITTSYVVNTDENCIVFDVTQYVIERYLAGETLVDFYLIAQDETDGKYDYFFSRESQGYAPKLQATYYNPAIWSSGRANIDSSIIVTYRKNLSSRLRVRIPARLNVEIPSSIEVTRNNVVIGSVTVSKPDMPSKVKVMYRDAAVLPASLGVANKNTSAIGSSITVSRPSLPISFYIKDRKDLNSTVIVKVVENADFFSWIIVNAWERPSSLYVTPHNDIQLSFTVRGKTGEDLPSSIAVSIDKFSGSVTVKQKVNKDLTGKVEIQKYSQSELSGQVSVSATVNKDLYSELNINVITDDSILGSLYVLGNSVLGTVYVRYTGNLGSQVTVKPAWFAYLPTLLSVSVPDVTSSIEVQLPADLISSITVKAAIDSGLAAGIAVNRPELTSSIEVSDRDDLDSTLRVQAKSDNSITGSVSVSRFSIECSIKVNGSANLDSSAEVRRENGEAFEGVLAVSRPNITSTIEVLERRDIESSLFIMFGGTEDLGSKIYVKYMNDILGSIEVWGASMIPSSIRIISGNLASCIAVPAYDNKDLMAIIGIKNRFISEIPSMLQVQEWSQFTGTISVQAFGENDLAGQATIIRNENRDLVSVIIPLISNYLPSTIGVRFDNWMTGKADFIPVGGVDLESSVEVNPSSGIEGRVTVVINSVADITGNMVVRGNGVADLGSDVKIVYRGNSDLVTALGVPALNKMTGKVFIIPVADSDLLSYIEAHVHNNLPSKLSVRQSADKDLKSSIEIHIFNELEGTVAVRRVAYEDLTSKIAVRVWGKNEKVGKIVIRQRDNSDIGGSINTIQWKVLNSKITVRRSAFSEIPMRFEILEKSDLLGCSITVRRTEKFDLTSTITIRRSANKDLGGRIVARRSDNSDLPSFIETWQFRTVPSKLYVLYRNDLISTINVVADYGYCFIM
ncbi:DNRLRE domain-containing protein [Paenibacillus polysaccharolyticus]|uniref:DNRLRE domain-containing protein n=1 Tax=Paenibacillus polysaccharolyticus TaxID=582692 RepID=UPI00203C7937|nr:DNRLRE domain-containing protein [Paenibacillus polysaccharolyticus]MCM3132913.1 DNRLRE domain-containing protein [Paenibacillus polysaccharolyticus]